MSAIITLHYILMYLLCWYNSQQTVSIQMLRKSSFDFCDKIRQVAGFLVSPLNYTLWSLQNITFNPLNTLHWHTLSTYSTNSAGMEREDFKTILQASMLCFVNTMNSPKHVSHCTSASNLFFKLIFRSEVITYLLVFLTQFWNSSNKSILILNIISKITEYNYCELFEDDYI